MSPGARPAYAEKEETDEMTKERVLEIIKEYEASKTEQNPGGWSAEARAWAEQNGIITGFGNGKMGYQAPCTREMAVAFLHRLWNLGGIS